MYIPPTYYQVKTSNGSLLFRDSLQPYVGPYIEVVNGKLLTGTQPTSTSRELIRNLDLQKESSKLEIYPKKIKVDKTKDTIERFFAFKVNNPNNAFEIDKNQYNHIISKAEPNSFLYEGVKVIWKIKGDVLSLNIKEINRILSKYPNLNKLLNNPQELYVNGEIQSD